MVTEQIQKYVYLLDLLYRNKQGLTLVEINERWRKSDLSEGKDLAERTFHRYKTAIEDLFKIDIECQSGTYRYYLPHPEDIERQQLYQWLLSTFSMLNLVQKNESLSKRILTESQPSGEKFLEPILKAMEDGYLIKVNHQSYWKPEPNKDRVLAPYGLKVFRQRWYLIAKDINKGELRTYSLDRVRDLEILEEHFTFPEDFSLRDYFKDSFGIITDEDYDVEEVRLKAYDWRRFYIRDLPLHSSQTIEEEGEDYTTFSFRLRASEDFQQELMSYADEIEVLSPQWLRDELKRRSLQAVENNR